MIDIVGVYFNYRFMVLFLGVYFFIWSVMLFFDNFVDMVFIKNVIIIGKLFCYSFLKVDKRNMCS